MKRVVFSIWPLALTLLLFVAISAAVRTETPLLKSLMAQRAEGEGMIAFFLLSMAAVLIPFVSSIPLLPVATALWGWQTAGLLTFGAWMSSSFLLFLASRSLGRKRIQRLLPASRFASLISGNQSSTTGLILLRMILPIDMMTYALALFTDIGSGTFLFVTASLAVPAFAYASLGTLPPLWQAVLVAGGIGLAWAGIHAAPLLKHHKPHGPAHALMTP